MTASALEIVGRSYANANHYAYAPDPVIIGAAYLIERDYSDPKVVIAKQRYSDVLVVHEDRRWRAGLVNPPTLVGDVVTVLEAVEGTEAGFRRDRPSKVIEVNEDGVLVKQGRLARFTAKFWVLHADTKDARKENKRMPDRRDMVLGRLSREGMQRITDRGYAISAKEFFTHFDLPRPEVQPTAFLDVEREMSYNDMGYELRGVFDNDNMTSLRTATIKGRAKIALPASTCVCKDVTQEQVVAQWEKAHKYKKVTLHKVECLWCTAAADGRVEE